MAKRRSRRFDKLKSRRARIARERISILLEQAEANAKAGHQDLADRHSQLARRIGMRYQVKMPRGFNIYFCKKCNSYLVPSKNSRVRMTGGRITRQCLKCGSSYRVPLGDRRNDHGKIIEGKEKSGRTA